MADFEKIKDENLENVTGGARRYYTVYSERDGYSWAELDDGNWIACHLLD